MFGRMPYELMIRYWPTPIAVKNDRIVAQRMNFMPKVVFSSTLVMATCHNTTVAKGDLAAEIRKLKNGPGDDMAILGSGTLVSRLANEGLVDEFQIVIMLSRLATAIPYSTGWKGS